jgi:hypothetical protein
MRLKSVGITGTFVRTGASWAATSAVVPETEPIARLVRESEPSSLHHRRLVSQSYVYPAVQGEAFLASPAIWSRRDLDDSRRQPQKGVQKTRTPASVMGRKRLCLVLRAPRQLWDPNAVFSEKAKTIPRRTLTGHVPIVTSGRHFAPPHPGPRQGELAGQGLR